ncbi:MAG: 50S ribosomal protein L10 [Endomicrobiia bacterium]|nr:50S ribosomal protein L10 [Endomicrobiaceae bacterium]MDD3922911.1 50S ribosomal protein L10 [Endomicrobiaceae bacterium]MDD5101986.1 50S ribosomal protein L10 [Endomicrobiaceae bacterium]
MPNKKNQTDVKVLADKFKAMKGMIMTEYHGLSVSEISELRSELRKCGCEYLVVKNTLSKIALKEVGLETVNQYFDGPTAVVVESTDPVEPAKIVSEFAKKYGKFVVKAGLLDGKILGAAEIKSLASLPSKEVLIAKMLGSMMSPISGFVNVLQGTTRNLVYVLNAIKEKQVNA